MVYLWYILAQRPNSLEILIKLSSINNFSNIKINFFTESLVLPQYVISTNLLSFEQKFDKCFWSNEDGILADCLQIFL